MWHFPGIYKPNSNLTDPPFGSSLPTSTFMCLSAVKELRPLASRILQKSRGCCSTFLYDHVGETCCYAERIGINNGLAARVVKLLPDDDGTTETTYDLIAKLRNKDTYNHTNIARFFSFKLDSNIFILSPWSRYGNSFQYVSKNTECSPHGQKLTSLVRQMASGVAYLHKSGITHGNLSPGNIIVVDYDTIVITDIGLYAIQAAANIASGGNVKICCSSPYKPLEEAEYEPAEGLQGFFEPSKSTDSYSFAACAYAVYTRRELIHANP
ncbi:hypothetical protein AX15_003101 [Amanita polypyramis BW_CC]|nr:hypothetical protein AX15_003101 [Amanita polypyramis BW_CC]